MDLDFEFLNLFGLKLDLDWILKIQDWIWIGKEDSPLISDGLHAVSTLPQQNCTFVL